MKGTKTEKLSLSDYGKFLHMEKGCYVVKDKEGNTAKFPVVEDKLGEIILSSGNLVSVGALVHACMWDIDILLLTKNGRPVGTIRNLHNDAHIKTRLCQFKATDSEKGLLIAKTITLKRIESQNLFLKKYGLRQHDIMRIKETIRQLEETNLKALRRKLLPIEGRCSNRYFSQMFLLFAPDIRTANNRKTYRAFDGLNNNLNLLYTLLKWKVHSSIVQAKLEPYCGFLHSEQFGKPSLLCDVMELYRTNVDEFFLNYSRDLERKDYRVETVKFARNKYGKREYLTHSKNKELRKAFYRYLETAIDIPRMRVGNRMTIETLISEECQLLGKYLRNETEEWNPRIFL